MPGILDDIYGVKGGSGVLDEIYGTPSGTNQRLGFDARNVPELAQDAFVPKDRSIEEYIKANSVPGIPFNGTKGIGGVERISMGAIRGKEAQLAYLKRNYPQENVRLSDEGEWIVRVNKEDGSVEDRLFDEKGVSGKDILDMLGSAPAFIASIAASKMAGPGVIGQSLAGAGAYGAIGGAQDIGTRAMVDAPVDIEEIAKYRGTEAALNAIGGVAIGGGLKGLEMGINSAGRLKANWIAKRTTTGANAAQAAERIKGVTGEELTLMPAEVIGSKSVTQMNELLERWPMISAMFGKAKLAKQRAEESFQRYMTGGPPPTMDDVAMRLNKTYRPGAVAAADDVAQAADDLATVGNAEMAAPFRGAKSGSDPFRVGSNLQQTAVAKKDAWKGLDDQLYSKVRELPEADEDIFPLRPVADAAQDILERMPSTPGVKVTGADLLEGADYEFIKDIPKEVLEETVDEGQRQLLRSFIENDVLGRVQNIANKGGEKTRWFDLVQMRRIVQDAIERRSEVFGDIGTYNLKRLSRSITKAIEEGTEGATGEFKKRLLAANAHHSTIEQFDDPLINRMLRDPSEAGAIVPEDVANRIVAGGKGSETMWNKLENFYGKNSTAMQQATTHFKSELLERVSNPTTKTIDPSKLISTLDKMEPGMKSKLFNQAELSVAETAARAMEVGTGKITLAQADQLFDAASKSPAALTRSLNAIAKQNALYRDNAIAKAAAGELYEVNPIELNSLLLQAGKVPASTKRMVMADLARNNPAGAQEVKRLYISDLFDGASKAPATPEAIQATAQGGVGWQMDPVKFASYFNSPDKVNDMMAVLGNGPVKLLRDYATYLAPSASRAAGAGLGPSTAVKSIITLTENMSAFAKMAVFGAVLSNPKIVKMLTTTTWKDMDMGPIIRTLMLSPEFADAVSGDLMDSAVPWKQNQRYNQLMKVAEELKPKSSPLRLMSAP